MPEKPEVVTVAKKLSLKLIVNKFNIVVVLWTNILDGAYKLYFEV